jgi:NADH dehydrogenase FAD-containing subunit
MLPGHISGIYSREEMFIDLRQLCGFSGARFIHAQAYGIDLKRKQVLIGFNGSTLPADVISINIGSTSCIAGTPGAAAQAEWNWRWQCIRRCETKLSSQLFVPAASAARIPFARARYC